MTDAPKPFYLVLDANAWVSERMLYSSAGEAVLYALAGNAAGIGLPEIVRVEVDRILSKFAEKAISELRKNLVLLRQLSGRDDRYAIPNSEAIRDGMAKRWKDLDGAFVHVPFTFEHSKSALQRILDHKRPAMDNNEQFRDCCIWATVLDLAEKRPVHFVSGDAAFFDRDRSQIAPDLKAELEAANKDVRLYSNVQEFLAAVSQPRQVEESAIKEAIIRAVTSRALELVSDKVLRRYSLMRISEAKDVTIKGYATPKPAVIAVTFTITFELTVSKQVSEDVERESETLLKLEGSCSYSPGSGESSDVEISSWTHSLRGEGSWGGWSEHSSPDSDALQRFKQTFYL